MTNSNDLTFKNLCTVYKSLGLKDNTTSRQRKNGTVAFNDPQTDVKYSFNPTSGYFRRTYVNENQDVVSTALNPTFATPAGGTRRFLVEDQNEQMTLAIKNISSFRNKGGFKTSQWA